MSHPLEPVLFEQADPAARGEAHGELWRHEIGALCDIRLDLCLRRGRFRDAEQVLAVAAAHEGPARTHTPDLWDELCGVARGADRSPAEIVVLNQYTDLRDVNPGQVPEVDDPGGCTAIHVGGGGEPVLAQTWDTHGSAEPFVRVVRIRPPGGETDLVCVTVTGCLGMMGMASHGVAVAINNLSSTDAGLGVPWPAVVRRLLESPDAAAAKETLLGLPLTSGHHYMMADTEAFFGVETSGQHKVLTQQGPRAAHIHTNHCFDPVLRKYEAVSRASTTFARLNMATTLFAQQRPSDLDGVWDLLTSHDGHPRSICSHVDDEAQGDPSASRTVAVMAVRIHDGLMRVVRGCAHENDPLEIRVNYA